MKVTYKDATNDMTIQDCLNCQNLSIDVIVDEGRDVTFEVEPEA